MKKIIGVLLIGLLGFSGCGDNNDGTSPVGEAIPVAPFGVIHENPTYIWHFLQWATKYRIVVAGKYSTETPIIVEEYTAEEAGCESEDVLCMARPEATFSPSSDWQWKVRACANDECDYWSEPLDFKTSEDWGDPIPFAGGGGGKRFRQNNDGTVEDTGTDLTWLYSSDYAGRCVSFPECVKECERLKWEFIPVGEPGVTWFYAWRVPTSNELASLYYAAPKKPLTGRPNAAAFFDGIPFKSSFNFIWGTGPKFWTISKGPANHPAGALRYIWDFDPKNPTCPTRTAAETGDRGYCYDCWCVSKKVILKLSL